MARSLAFISSYLIRTLLSVPDYARCGLQTRHESEYCVGERTGRGFEKLRWPWADRDRLHSPKFCSTGRRTKERPCWAPKHNGDFKVLVLWTFSIIHVPGTVWRTKLSPINKMLFLSIDYVSLCVNEMLFSPCVVSFIDLQLFASKKHPIFHFILSDKRETPDDAHQSAVIHIAPVLNHTSSYHWTQ